MKKNIKYEDLEFEKYIENYKILERTKQISDQINGRYINDEVVFVGILNGCIPFMNELLSNVTIPYKYNFIKISSYSKTESGNIKFELGLSEDDIFDKTIIVIEDIIDSGKSIKFIHNYLSEFNPKSIKVASLLIKEESIGLCDWYGFKISDKFVIGFGMDIDDSFRYLKDIYQKV